jgi:hypothetical protein
LDRCQEDSGYATVTPLFGEKFYKNFDDMHVEYLKFAQMQDLTMEQIKEIFQLANDKLDAFE